MTRKLARRSRYDLDRAQAIYVLSLLDFVSERQQVLEWANGALGTRGMLVLSDAQIALRAQLGVEVAS